MNIFNFSSPSVNISFSSLLLSDLLSLFVSGIMTHKRELSEGLPGTHVETLDGFGKSWDNRFYLTDITSTPYSDVDIEKACVLGNDKR